ncbi:MAG: hypothetical protein KGJ07_06110 [Patescibacteria group bacterium]|nr:hypothetical protein [Patescibacteria group bacterium]
MTEQPTTSSQEIVQPEQQPPTASSSRIIRIVSGGLFELIFVILCIGFLLGVLNYFNIIDLSKTYAPLAMLPKINQIITPTPGQPQFSYDKEAASTQLFQSSTDALIDLYKPVINSKDYQDSIQSDNIFSYTWLLNNSARAEGKIINRPLSNDTNYFQLTIASIATNSATENMATDSATQILAGFFKPFPGKTPLNCTAKTTPRVCEQFDTTI